MLLSTLFIKLKAKLTMKYFGLFLLSVLHFTNLNAQAQESIFWTETRFNEIRKIDLTGGSNTQIVSNQFAPFGIALDTTGNKMYWVDFTLSQLKRANLDGSNVELLAENLGAPQNLALDLVNNKIYVTGVFFRPDRFANIPDTVGRGVILRTNLDGSNVELVADLDDYFSTSTPRGIQIDLVNNHLYYAETGSGGAMVRFDLNPVTGEVSNFTNLFNSIDDRFGFNPYDFNLDLTSGFMYITDAGINDAILKARIDGTGNLEVLSEASVSTLQSLSIDPVNRHIYYLNLIPAEIRRINFDNTGDTQILNIPRTDQGAPSPQYIAGTLEPVANSDGSFAPLRLTGLSDIIQSNDEGQSGATINLPVPTIINGVGNITVTTSLNEAPGASVFFPVGTTTVTYTASDEATGQEVTETITITIESTVGSIPFISTWKTTSANESITIPTNSAYTYDYVVDWGDGSTSTGQTGNATHQYATAGTYIVSLSGDFPAIHFASSPHSNKLKIRTVQQWGNIQWKTMNKAFQNCRNLTASEGKPDLSQVTDLRDMFNGAINFNGNISNWDVSTITTMNGMFANAYDFNKNLNAWNVGQVTDMQYMFYSCYAFNGNISNWDVSNVTKMRQMFQNARSFDQDISAWDVSKVTRMDGMFAGAHKFNRNLSNWDISNVTTMNTMFNSSGMSVANYDTTIIGWSELASVKNGVVVGAKGIKYCASASARQQLISTYGWVFWKDSEDCSAQANAVALLTSQKSTDFDLDIYPNPATVKLDIKAVKRTSIVILTLQGKEMYRSLENTTRHQVNIASFPEGMYLLLIYGEEGDISQQLFLKK